MSTLTDKTANYLYNALFKGRRGVGDMERFRETGIRCWRCGNPLETYYCEEGLYAVRCQSDACAGVFLVKAGNPNTAAEKLTGTEGVEG